MKNKGEKERIPKGKLPPTSRGRKRSSPEGKKSQGGSSESGELFRAIAEGAGDAIIVVDNEGKVSYWNPASEKMFGYSSQQATGKNLDIIVPERYHEKYRETVKTLREQQEHLNVGSIFESEAIRQDGTEFPVEVSVSTVLINGRWHAVCTIRDITRRRRAQEELGNILAKYQLICDNQKDALIMVDMETQQFLEVNKAAVNAYGYSREEFLNMRITDIFAEAENDLDAGSPGKANIFVHKRKGGDAFPVEITACVFNWKGRRTFCAVIREITGRQLNEI